MMAVSIPMTVSLKSLLEGISVIGEVPDLNVSGLSMDSRTVMANDAFLACAGYQSHGLEYLTQAIDNGASIILAEVTAEWLPERLELLAAKYDVAFIAISNLSEQVSLIAGRFYSHPSRSFPVIGITGTNGKTSCSQFIAQAFSGIRKVAVLGTLGNGFPGDLETSTHTTMDPVSVQASMSLLKDQKAEMVAMEVSSHALHQGRVAAIDFDVAVLTNLSRDHLDYHGTMADYASAKSLLFSMPSLKSALINADDEFGIRLLKDLTKSSVRCIAYGSGIDQLQFKDWIRADNIKASSGGLSFSVISSWGCADVDLPLMGKFNVSNALVALGVLLEQGVEFVDAIIGMQKLKTVSGRMELFSSENTPSVVIDFAHTPDALEQVLTSLKDHVDKNNSGKLICVFGCGGDRDKGKRPLMGAVAESLADVVVLTDDNPRHESSIEIIEDILKGIDHVDNVLVEHDRSKAIADAIKNASINDVILIAGKGHESYQIQGDMKFPFSDQKVVKAAMGLL